MNTHFFTFSFFLENPLVFSRFVLFLSNLEFLFLKQLILVATIAVDTGWRYSYIDT